MHTQLTHAAWFGIFAVAGLVAFLAAIIPEIRWQRRWTPGSMLEPSFWFWLTILLGLCCGLIPYLLVHMVVA